MPKTVKLGARDYPLVLPESYTQRTEILAAAHSNGLRAFAAALGACCPKLNRMLDRRADEKKTARPPTYHGARCDALVYGGQLIDCLVDAGVEMSEILIAGRAAFELLAGIEISEADVEAAAGNSAPPAGG